VSVVLKITKCFCKLMDEREAKWFLFLCHYHHLVVGFFVVCLFWFFFTWKINMMGINFFAGLARFFFMMGESFSSWMRKVNSWCFWKPKQAFLNGASCIIGCEVISQDTMKCHKYDISTLNSRACNSIPGNCSWSDLKLKLKWKKKMKESIRFNGNTYLLDDLHSSYTSQWRLSMNCKCVIWDECHKIAVSPFIFPSVSPSIVTKHHCKLIRISYSEIW
jgi:hypothetical protein